MLDYWKALVLRGEPGGLPVRSRRVPLLVALGFLLLGLLIYAPALGGQRFIYGTDTFTHDYLMHWYGWKQSLLGRGELPLWCPYLFCGLPFIGSAALCPFYPTQWLYALLPFNTTFTLQYVLAVALAGFGFYWWMRQLNVGRAVAVWGGAAFVVSGHFITLTYAGHLQKMIAIAWAPIALGAVARLMKQSDRPLRNPHFVKCAIVLCVAWSMQLFASHPQIFYATVGCCVLYVAGSAVLRLRTKSAQPRTWKHVAKVELVPTWWTAGALTLALVLSILLSAAQMFPTMEMHRVSNRAQGVSFSEAVETSYPPGELLEYVIPSMSSDSVRGTAIKYQGKWGERIVSDYVGSAMVLLAGLGLVASRRRMRWYLLALAVVSIVIGLGKSTPLYYLCYKLLPGFQDFRSPGTFMFVADMAVVALACFGVEAVSQLVSADGKRWMSTFAARARTEDAESSPSAAHWITSNWLAATCGAVLVICIGAALIGVDQVSGTRLDIATESERARYLFYRDMWIFAAELGLAAALLVALKWYPRPATLGLAALALIFPVVHNRHFVQFESLASYTDYIVNQPAFAPLANAAQPIRLLEENRFKSDPMLSNVATASGYHPVTLENYDWLSRTVGIDSELFTGSYAVNYARTYAQRMGAAGNWQPVGKYRKSGRFEYLWRRAPGGDYFPPSKVIACEGGTTGERNALAQWNKQQEDAQQHTADVNEPSGATANAPSLDATFVSVDKMQRLRIGEGIQQGKGWLMSWSPNHVQFRIASPLQTGRSLLRLAELAAPGWHVNDQAHNLRIPVLQVNGSQRALAVPYGEGVVDMKYSPFSMRLGLFCSLAMVALGMSGGIGSVSRKVRRAKKRLKRKAMSPASAGEMVGPPGLEPGTNRL